MANATPFFTRSPKTIVVYPINGQTEFTIPFEFLARKFVVVTLLGVDRLPLVLNTDYRFVSVNRIQLLSPVPAGYPNIELRRLTSATDRLVDFHDGSILRAYDLNLAQIQTMHVAEEARDLTSDTLGVNDKGDLDARNRKIVNLANGEDPFDAVNLGQLRQFDTSTANNADRAEAAKNRAVQAETNTARDSASAAVNATKAVASAGTAVQAASDANRSYDKIVPLEQSTVANAQVATQQAQRAQNEADRAKSEADKLGNMNDFAQTISRVVGDVPYFKNGLMLGEASPVSNVQFYSRPDASSPTTRKGFVGMPDYNSTEIWLHSDSGDAKVLAAETVTINGKLVRILNNGNKTLLECSDGGNVRVYGNLDVRADPNSPEGGEITLSYKGNWDKKYYLDVDGSNAFRIHTEGRVLLWTSNSGDNSVTVSGNLTLQGNDGRVGRLQYDGNVIGSAWTGGALSTHLSTIYARPPIWHRLTGDTSVSIGERFILNDNCLNATVRFWVPAMNAYMSGEAPEGDGIQFVTSIGGWFYVWWLEYGGTQIVLKTAGGGAQPVANAWKKKYQY